MHKHFQSPGLPESPGAEQCRPQSPGEYFKGERRDPGQSLEPFALAESCPRTGALSSLAGRQSLREHLACSFLPVKVEPPAFALHLPLSFTFLWARPARGLGCSPHSSILRSPWPAHSSPPLRSPLQGRVLRGTLGCPPRPQLCIQWECSVFDPLFLRVFRVR